MRRAPPRTPPPRGSVESIGLPWRGLWISRTRRARALKAARASSLRWSARARLGERLGIRPR
eukprot:1388048-Pyramimonas_sp.AAC.1